MRSPGAMADAGGNVKAGERRPARRVMMERLATLGFDAILSTPDEFNARIKVDIQKWANVIRAANIRVE